MQVFLQSFINTFLTASPYMVLGLVVSGLIHVYLPQEQIKRWFSGTGPWPILKASFLGVPLPLCSCSVIPVAISLRKSGASKGATSAFLISTPESGIDSVLLTYGLMGLPMAILRPVGALCSALVAGIFQQIFNDEIVEEKIEKMQQDFEEEEHQHDCCSHEKVKIQNQFSHKIQKAMRYAFIDLIEDMAGWFFLGLIFAALISALVPYEVISKFNGPMGRVAIILLSIPLYICASAATPVAAAMVLKGLSPGSSLLFLFLGPATNISNILVLQKFLGKRAIILNLLAIFLVSLAFASAVDYFGITITGKSLNEIGEHFHYYDYFSAVLFALFLVRGLAVILINFLKGHEH